MSVFENGKLKPYVPALYYNLHSVYGVSPRVDGKTKNIMYRKSSANKLFVRHYNFEYAV